MLFFNKDEFRQLLKNLGVHSGDKLFVHSFCGILGKITDINDVITAILEAIDYSGIIAMPAYSYFSWPATHYFDPFSTKAETGILPNAFIHFKGVYRTIQGNHSVAVWGDKEHCVIRDWISSSFSKESTIFQTIVQGFKNVMIGTPFSTGCSMFHCIEEELNVPYRFRKSFPGIVQIGQERREFDFTMYVRDLAYTVDLRKAEPYLEGADFVTSNQYNYGRIVIFPLQDAYDIVKKQVKNNPLFFVSEINK